MNTYSALAMMLARAREAELAGRSRTHPAPVATRSRDGAPSRASQTRAVHSSALSAPIECALDRTRDGAHPRVSGV